MNESSFQKVVNAVVPSTGAVTYNEAQNVLLTTAYTSLAGNTYFKGIRLSNAIMIVVDVGIGHTHTFLNGVKIYSTVGEKKQITERLYSVRYYSETTVKAECISMICQKVVETAELNGHELSLEDIKTYAHQLVEEAYNSNQIEVIKKALMDNLLAEPKSS